MQGKQVREILEERKRKNLDKTLNLGETENSQATKRITIYLNEREYALLEEKAKKNLKKVGGYVKNLVIQSIVKEQEQ